MGLYKLGATSIPPLWYPSFLHEPQPGLPCGPHTQDTPLQATPLLLRRVGPTSWARVWAQSCPYRGPFSSPLSSPPWPKEA